MERVLLVNPWIYDFAAYDLWMKPMGLLYLAAILRRNGYHTDFLDCLDPYHSEGIANCASSVKMPKRKSSGKGHFLKEQVPKPFNLRDIKRRYYRFGISPHFFRKSLLEKPAPDLVLITSMMTYWYPGVMEAVGIIREVFSDVPIVLGGTYATLCTDHAELHSGADEVISGEGEKHLANIIRKYLDDDLTFLPGPHLDDFPYPAFELAYPIEQIPLVLSRGCPFSCTYCASHKLNPDGYRIRKPSRVVDEIEFWVRRFKVKHFAFYDDALLVNAESLITPMLEELIRRGLSCNFHCPNGLHLREITADLALLLFQSGFKTLRFGFETADIVRQAATGGKVVEAHLRHAAECLHKAGYMSRDIGVYLLCGLPGQNASEVYDSIRFVLDCGCRPILAEYSPIPGTALWQEAVNASDWDIAAEPLYQNNTLLPCRDQSLTDAVYHDLKKMTHLPFRGGQ